MANKKVNFANKAGKKSAQTEEFNPDSWVSTGEGKVEEAETIRFTIDIPTELHTRIKSQCAAKRVKMKEVIQDLLEKAFPPSR